MTESNINELNKNLIEEIESRLITQELWKNRRLIAILEKEIPYNNTQRIILDQEIKRLQFITGIIQRNLEIEMINKLCKLPERTPESD